MTITEICDVLRAELFNSGYEYGFYLDGVKYKPDMQLGFDEEYYKLATTIYRIQSPNTTKMAKIGTCIDACLLMRKMLRDLYIDSRIWLIHHRDKGSVHTILTFEAEDNTVYLELTPQSSKAWYGKEIIYNSIREFSSDFNKKEYDIFDVTDDVIIGEAPTFLLSHLK